MGDLRLLDEDCDQMADDVIIEATKRGYSQKLCDLVNEGANVNKSDLFGKTALMYAAETGNYKCMNVLIKAGADVNMSDHENNTALINAVHPGNDLGVKLLIDAGADVNNYNIEDHSALIRAVRQAQPNMVSLLIAAGARVNVQNDEGLTPIFYAIGRRFDYLRNYASDELGCKCIMYLCQAGADVNKIPHSGKTLLMKMLQVKNADGVQALLKVGADVNKLLPDTVLKLDHSYAKRRHLGDLLENQVHGDPGAKSSSSPSSSSTSSSESDRVQRRKTLRNNTGIVKLASKRPYLGYRPKAHSGLGKFSLTSPDSEYDERPDKNSPKETAQDDYNDYDDDGDNDDYDDDGDNDDYYDNYEDYYDDDYDDV